MKKHRAHLGLFTAWTRCGVSLDLLYDKARYSRRWRGVDCKNCLRTRRKR